MVFDAKRRGLVLSKDEDGDTLLHLSVVQKNMPLCIYFTQMVAQKGKNIDISNKMLQTPLHLACITKQPRMIKYFLDSGRAEASFKDRYGNTTLHLCVKHGEVQTLRLVLDHLKTNEKLLETINLYNYEGWTALHLAVFLDRTQHVNLLLAYSAEIDAQDFKSGKTPLYVAVQELNKETAKLLLEAGADPNSMTYFKDSPSQLASNINDRSLFRLFSSYSPGRYTHMQSPVPKIEGPPTLMISMNTCYKETKSTLNRKNAAPKLDDGDIPSFVELKFKRKSVVTTVTSCDSQNNEDCPDSTELLAKITQDDLSKTMTKQSINKVNESKCFDDAFETPLDLSVRTFRQDSISRKRGDCNEKNAVCETSLKRVSVTNTENETNLRRQFEPTTKKSKINNKQLKKDALRNQVRMSIKQEGETAIVSDKSIEKFLSSGSETTQNKDIRRALQHSTNSMSTTFHEGIGVPQSQGYTIYEKSPITAREFNTMPTSATLFAANGLPLEYYTPFLNSAVLKTGIPAIPYTWTNLALAHAMKTAQYERSKDADITAAVIHKNDVAIDEQRDTNAPANKEHRNKLHCSLSDSDKTKMQDVVRKNSKKFERRNSEPLQTSKIESDKSSSPQDLHSYTGCLPPHYLHLLQSSGNLPTARGNVALANINDLYIDPSRVNHETQIRDERRLESTLGFRNLHNEHQSKVSLPKSPVVSNTASDASQNGIGTPEKKTTLIYNVTVQSMTNPPNIKARNNHDNGEDNAEAKIDRSNVESDDDNMESIQISDDEADDDFEEILIKTAKDQLDKIRISQPSSYNDYVKQNNSWKNIDEFHVFNKKQLTTSSTASHDEYHVPKAKSGYQINQRIPTTNCGKMPKIVNSSIKKKLPKIKITPKCHHTNYKTHSCAGCSSTVKEKPVHADTAQLMFDILRHGGVNRKSYSSTKCETSVVFCSEREKPNPPTKEEKGTLKIAKDDSSKPCEATVSYTHKLFNRNRKQHNKTNSNEKKSLVEAQQESSERITEKDSMDIVKNKHESDGVIKLPTSESCVIKGSRKRSPPPYSNKNASKVAKSSLYESNRVQTIPYATTIKSQNSTHRYIFPSVIPSEKIYHEAAYFPLHTLGLSPLLIRGLKLNANNQHVAALRNYQNVKRQKLTAEDEKLEITDLEISDDES